MKNKWSRAKLVYESQHMAVFEFEMPNRMAQKIADRLDKKKGAFQKAMLKFGFAGIDER